VKQEPEPEHHQQQHSQVQQQQQQSVTVASSSMSNIVPQANQLDPVEKISSTVAKDQPKVDDKVEFIENLCHLKNYAKSLKR
jgi:hypothetical protein